MTNGYGLRRLLACAGMALGCSAVAPAHAQFMSAPYPVIVVPPPPAQGLVMPKRVKPQPAPVVAPPPAEPPTTGCRYQGRTKICE